MVGSEAITRIYERGVDALRSLFFANSVVSEMILPVLCFLLCTTVTVSLFEGDPCSLTNGDTGICAFVDKCPFVYEQLLAGVTPDTICGFERDRDDPIICCPKSTPTTIEPVTTPVVDFDSRQQGDGRGQIADRKCAEYAQYVWRWLYIPELQKTINASQCAPAPAIAGGITAHYGEFPYMAAIGYKNSDTGEIGWLCGGTLISEIWVLTAAHCAHAKGWSDAELVRVGDVDLKRSDDKAKSTERRIVEKIQYPEYNPPQEYHDIALFRLETRVPFNRQIRPACLHTRPSTETPKVTATGWGRVGWIGDLSNHLLKVELPLVESQTCKERWSSNLGDTKLPNGVNTDWMICAAGKGKDTCQGDSGGPLVIYSSKSYYCMDDVVGVTSLGRFCGSNFPSVYTRVYHYVPWIESVVWPEG